MSRHAFILAGGLGTRLHSVTHDSIPKALADIAGRPFLDYFLDELQRSGAVRAVTLCIGHHGAMIQARYGHMYNNMPVTYAVETRPLGTGGALAAAFKRFVPPSEPVFAFNGDCVAACDLAALSECLSEEDSGALALAHVPDASRFGAVSYDDHHTITAFNASGAAGAAYINAGRYCLRPERLLSACPQQDAFSLEHDYFRPAAAAGVLRALPFSGAFLDIGVPDDYKAAQTVVPAALRRR